jgi:hypothetical protein
MSLYSPIADKPRNIVIPRCVCVPALPGRRISLESWQTLRFLRTFGGHYTRKVFMNAAR